MKLTLKKQQQSVLGLSLGQGQLRAVLVARSKGVAEVVKTASAALALDLLHLEAERGFPCDVAQLQIARSLQRLGGVTYVTQLAVRQEQLNQLASVARAA